MLKKIPVGGGIILTAADAAALFDSHGGAVLATLAGGADKRLLYVRCLDGHIEALTTCGLEQRARSPWRWVANTWGAARVLLPELINWSSQPAAPFAIAIQQLANQTVTGWLGKDGLKVYCDGSFNPGTGRSGVGIVISSADRDLGVLTLSLGNSCLSPLKAEMTAVELATGVMTELEKKIPAARLELLNDAANIKSKKYKTRYIRGSVNPAHLPALLATRIPPGKQIAVTSRRELATLLTTDTTIEATCHIDLSSAAGYRRMATLTCLANKSVRLHRDGVVTAVESRSACLRNLARDAARDEILVTGICGVPTDMAKAAGFRV